jgi:hypothetical protein
LSDFEGPTRRGEVNTTRATARLPDLDIEIVHRRSPGGDAEQLSINLEAVRSFAAFGRFVENANPFAFWARAVQLTWLPWLVAAQAVMPPSLRLPQMDSISAARWKNRRHLSRHPLPPVSSPAGLRRVGQGSVPWVVSIVASTRSAASRWRTTPTVALELLSRNTGIE